MNHHAKTKLSKNPDFAWRRVADELILVPIRGRTEELDSVYSLNETAARVWELIDDRSGREEIELALQREFQVEAKQAAADLAELLDELIELGAVRELPR